MASPPSMHQMFRHSRTVARPEQKAPSKHIAHRLTVIHLCNQMGWPQTPWNASSLQPRPQVLATHKKGDTSWWYALTPGQQCEKSPLHCMPAIQCTGFFLGRACYPPQRIFFKGKSTACSRWRISFFRKGFGIQIRTNLFHSGLISPGKTSRCF